jgi:hypothetical protein
VACAVSISASIWMTRVALPLLAAALALLLCDAAEEPDLPELPE